MTTTLRGWRLPALTAAPNVPLDMQNLGTDADADMTAHIQARRVMRTTTITVPDSTTVAIASFDVPSDLNVGGIAYAAGVFTPSVAGLYVWALTVNWPSASSTGSAYSRTLAVQKNGASAPYDEGTDQRHFSGAAVGTMHHSAGGPILLAAADTLQPVLAQTSGSSITPTPTMFALYRVA